MRLLFTTAPLRGHFFPLVPLAWAARALGHDVLVATTENFAPIASRSGLPVVSWGPPMDVIDLVAEEPAISVDRVQERRFAHGRAFGRVAARCLPGARSVIEDWKPDLVVCERAEFAGPLAATANDVPYVEYHWGVAPLEEYRSAAAAELAGALETNGLPTPRPPIRTLNPWPPGMRLPHAEDHDGLRNVPFNGDEQVPGWTLEERRRRRVCVTFGTVLPRIEELGIRQIVAAMLAELARLDVELVVAADENTVAAWPEFSATAHRVGRLPLAQVLPTCDLVVNHGGQGTVLTALAAGCPQLVLPHIDDQFDNAEAAVGAGVGMSLSFDEITPASVTEHCRTLLDDDQYSRAAVKVANDIAAQLSPVEIMNLLEKVVG